MGTPRHLQKWLADHHLLDPGVKVDAALHREALTIREGLRALLRHAPDDRRAATTETTVLAKALRRFPVVVGWDDHHQMTLQRSSPNARGALETVVAGIYHAAVSGQLDRLKTCPSDECHWIFLDRTKPNTGVWCDPNICGNREKKRAYRRRKNM